MFGMSLTEVILIAIIAILFLGPDKLPKAMVQIAKFIKGIKKTVESIKDTLDSEVNISEIKEEALSYKKQLDEATKELGDFKNISNPLDKEIKDIKKTVSLKKREKKIDV